MSESEQEEGSERRATPERRRYNRRTAPSVTPPYFETFERIALALEKIAQTLEQRSVRMPDVPTRSRTSSDRG